MSHIVPKPELFASLKGKTVVITGGATGIGRAFVLLAHGHGANLVVGDVAAEAAQKLADTLGPRCRFVRCDTSNYQDQLALFRTAQEAFGGVDVVLANAAVNNFTELFIGDQSDDIEHEPRYRDMDINLKGVMHTARIGLHYLRKNGGGDLVMTSSIGGFKETASLTPYMAAKHGVIGLLRGLRLSTMDDNIRVNVVCPWMTRTAMTTGIEKGWYQLNLPVNEPEDVARAMLICATANRAAKDKLSHTGAVLPFHGKIVYVSGGEAYEIEDRMQELEPFWLGRENSRVLAIGQDYLHNGRTDWDYVKIPKANL